MHPAPPLSVRLARSPALRLAAVFISAAALAALAAWLVLHWPDDSAPMRAGRLGLCAITLGLAVQAWRRTAARAWILSWSGQRWTLRPPEAAPATERAGALQVRLDLAGWLLLEFVPETADGADTRHIWLMPSRFALCGQWHALRCAVYSPRPASLVAPADGPPAAHPPP